VLVLPAVSAAVHVTVVVPTGKNDPDARAHETLATAQLSVAVAFAYVTTLPIVQEPDAASALAVVVMFAGHAIAGGCVSSTRTVKEHAVWLPPASRAVQVTVVVPTGKNDPDAGRHETVVPGQLSIGVGVVYVTFAPHWSGAFGTIAFGGHWIVGGCASATVTVNEQLSPPTSVQVTVVTPIWNVEPGGGTQATGPQLPVVVGSVYFTTAPHVPGSFTTETSGGHTI
jgi:hypothetical protein